jgi:hypothetical protein
VAPVGWWNNMKYLNKKELIPVPYTNMAAISLFWYTNMAAVTSDENDLLNLDTGSWCEYAEYADILQIFSSSKRLASVLF